VSDPKIISMQIEETAGHFHAIDYKKDLSVKLQKTVTFGEPGLMTKVEYFADEDKVDRVLDVIREYDVEEVTNKILRKKTIRIYYNEDGTQNDNIKDTGWYTYTPEESRSATHRRRVNVTNKLESDMLALLLSAAGSDQTQQTANLAAGANFMKALSSAINTFHLSGSNLEIIEFVSNPENQQNFLFLLADVAPGVKAYQFIIAGVSY